MKLRPTPKSDKVEPNEEWDIASVPDTSSRDSQPIGHILLADEVAAARFQKAREGYSFKQVETLIKEVIQTLRYREQVEHEKDVEIYEVREENNDLQDRLFGLQATIEVFRANGDPLVNEEGEYITESQMPNKQAEQELAAQLASVQEAYDTLRVQYVELSAAYTVLQETTMAMEAAAPVEAQSAPDLPESMKNLDNLSKDDAIALITSLVRERDRLELAVAATELERDEADAAEAAMRNYVEVTLAEWMRQQTGEGSNDEDITAVLEEAEKEEYHELEDLNEEVEEESPVIDISDVSTPEELEELTASLSSPDDSGPFIEDELVSPTVYTIDEVVLDEENEEETEEDVFVPLVVEKDEEPEQESFDNDLEWEDAPSVTIPEPSPEPQDPEDLEEAINEETPANDDDEEEEEEEELLHVTVDESATPPVEMPPPASEDRTSILLSAPEVADSKVDPSFLPMPSGAPVPNMPAPRQRQKASLDDAPELHGN